MGRRKRKGKAFGGYRAPSNGDRELRGIMKEFVRTMAGKKGLPPEDYEKRIRRDGTYTTMRRMCHKLLFLIEKVCEEVLAQEASRRALRPLGTARDRQAQGGAVRRAQGSNVLSMRLGRPEPAAGSKDAAA